MIDSNIFATILIQPTRMIIMDIMEQLNNWHLIKKELECENNQIPQFREQEIWWCYVGQNLGSEIYGKGDKFIRPVYIFKKINAKKFIGIPLKSHFYHNDNRYYPLKIKERESAICFNEIRSFSAKRLMDKYHKLSDKEHLKIREALKSYFEN